MKQLFTICLCGFACTALGATCQEQAAADVILQRAIQKDWTPLHVVSAHNGSIHAFPCVNGTRLNRLTQKFNRDRDYQKAPHIARILCQDPAHLPRLVKGPTITRMPPEIRIGPERNGPWRTLAGLPFIGSNVDQPWSMHST